MMEELLILQEEEKERQAFSQRVGRTGTFNWDLETNQSTWTREFEALYGHTERNYKGGNFQNWIKHVHKDDRKRVQEEITHALEHSDEVNIEFRVVWPDKSVHYLLTRARIIRDNKGKASEVSGVNIDITERKQIETKLHYLAEASKTLSTSLNYEETLKAVVELGVPEIADWCAVDILTENNQIKRIAVAHVDPKKVKWAWELNKKNPPHMDKESVLTHVLKTGKSAFMPIITEEMIQASKPSKEQLDVINKIDFKSIIIVPLIVENRPMGALTFVTTGESNRYFTQSDLTIAEEVASRAALAIHNSRLFTDSQKAIAIRDEFISVASHELKTPVTSLKMYTQIVLRQLEKKGDTSLATPLSKMDAQINKLTMLINDLLNISRIQLGKLEFNEESFDLCSVIKDTIDSVQSGIHTHKITLRGKLTKNVWGDKDRISQVVTNLLTNAVKYSPQADKVNVIVEQGRTHAMVTVKDHGIGIDKEQQKKIFNRFYRVSGPEERTFPGLGIGLYISAEIVTRHGGKITVDSTRGKGSEFSFTIPYKRPHHK
jgi:PAS domain S-box-containing protein